jgi:hypothetical protein
MPDVTVERRSARRHAMVLAAEVVELPSGAKLSARRSDISRTGWIAFVKVEDEQLARLDRWFSETDREF